MDNTSGITYIYLAYASQVELEPLSLAFTCTYQIKEKFPEGMGGEKTINRFLSAEFSRATGFVRNPLPELNINRI